MRTIYQGIADTFVQLFRRCAAGLIVVYVSQEKEIGSSTACRGGFSNLRRDITLHM